MATVTQLQNSHSKGSGSSYEGKGLENEFRWKTGLCSPLAVPCLSSCPWLLPFCHGYRPARGGERDAGGAGWPHPALSSPSPVPPPCHIPCTAPLLSHRWAAAPGSVFCTNLIFLSEFLLLKHLLCRRRWPGPLHSLQSKRFPGSSVTPALLQHRAPLQGAAELPQRLRPCGFPWASWYLRKRWLKGRRWFLSVARFISLVSPPCSLPPSTL